MDAREVLVVGATGILAPAASKLVAGGTAVTGLATGRRPAPRGVNLTALDARSATEVAGALGEHRFDAALVYEPAVTTQSLAVLRTRVLGRLVIVRTSEAADPARGPFSVPSDILQLGWTQERNGSRWHTAEEVSEAALGVLQDGVGRTLGVVRPWEGRP